MMIASDASPGIPDTQRRAMRLRSSAEMSAMPWLTSSSIALLPSPDATNQSFWYSGADWS